MSSADADDDDDVLAVLEQEEDDVNRKRSYSAAMEGAELSWPCSLRTKVRRQSAGPQQWASRLFAAFAAETCGSQRRECLLQSLCSGMGTEHMAMEAPES